MPIENLSNRVKIPRLGKIHLGVKDKTTREGHPIEYPKPTDYFVVPEEVQAVYGDKPKELDVMLPTEDPELFTPQYLKAYSLSQGLICRGDGIKATRKIDLKTGAVADSKTGAWDWREVSCNPQECEIYEKKQCRQIMNLLILLPKVQGLGVYQIDTSSYHSIININSMVKLLKAVVGRCSMIPLTLILRPQEVAPQGTTKKTVHVLDLRQNATLAEIAKLALMPPAQVFMPDVVEEMPEDFYPASVIGEHPGESKKTATRTKKEPQKEAGKHDTAAKDLIERIHAEAKKISGEYYESVIRPRMKATLGTDKPEDLKIEQLNMVLDWMVGKASEEDKRSFILKMKDLGFTTKDAVLGQIEKHAGKITGWTRGDLDKTLLASEKEKKASSQATDASQAEVEKFLAED